jgi:hypothetical protein
MMNWKEYKRKQQKGKLSAILRKDNTTLNAVI